MEFLKKLGSFFVTATTNRTLSLLLIVGVVVAIPLTVYVAQQQQEIRQQAFFGTGKEECEAKGWTWSATGIGETGYCSDPSAQQPSTEGSECDRICAANGSSKECLDCTRAENPNRSGRTCEECAVDPNCDKTTQEYREVCLGEGSTNPPAPTPTTALGNTCGNGEVRLLGGSAATACTGNKANCPEGGEAKIEECNNGKWTGKVIRGECNAACTSSGGNPTPTTRPGAPAPTTAPSNPAGCFSCANLPLIGRICNCGLPGFPSCNTPPGICPNDATPGQPNATPTPAPVEGARCSFPQACFNENTQGVQTCTGLWKKNICTYDDHTPSNCSPCQTTTPSFAGPTRSPGGACGSFASDIPGYQWVADCNKSCSNNDACPKNTSQGQVNPATSNQCYGFTGGNKCVQLRYQGSTGGSPGGSNPGGGSPGGGGSGSPTTAPTATQPKTCTINSAPISTENNEKKVNISFSGNGRTTESQNVVLWVRNVDPSKKINGLSEEVKDNDLFYYRIGSCASSKNTVCTSSKEITLPPGNYVTYCEIDTMPNRCSGNPICSYKAGPANCSNWVQCSQTDNHAIKIEQSTNPTNSPTRPNTTPRPTRTQTSGEDRVGLNVVNNPCNAGYACITPKPTRKQ